MGARRLVHRASLPDAALTRTGAAGATCDDARCDGPQRAAGSVRRAHDAHTTRKRTRSNECLSHRPVRKPYSTAGVRLEYLGGVDAQHTQQKVEPVRIDSRSPILARVPNNGTDKSEWKYGYREIRARIIAPPVRIVRNKGTDKAAAAGATDRAAASRGIPLCLARIPRHLCP